jgi:hypothetical protein
MPAPLVIHIPGDPVPQGRPRIVLADRRTGRRGLKDPERSAIWKTIAATHYMMALRTHGRERMPFRGAVDLHVLIVFRCPKADHRKGSPVQRRPHTKHSADASNVLKGVEDAANNVLSLRRGHCPRAGVHVTHALVSRAWWHAAYASRGRWCLTANGTGRNRGGR